MKRIVAVVDDDSRVLQALQNLLESAGHEVRLYGGAQQALSDPALGMMECLVTDVAMSGMDGIELGRRARRLRPSLPVIFITAHGMSQEAAETAVPGSRLLRKPFDGQALLDAIGRAVGD